MRAEGHKHAHSPWQGCVHHGLRASRNQCGLLEWCHHLPDVEVCNGVHLNHTYVHTFPVQRHFWCFERQKLAKPSWKVNYIIMLTWTCGQGFDDGSKFQTSWLSLKFHIETHQKFLTDYEQTGLARFSDRKWCLKQVCIHLALPSVRLHWGLPYPTMPCFLWDLHQHHQWHLLATAPVQVWKNFEPYDLFMALWQKTQNHTSANQSWWIFVSEQSVTLVDGHHFNWHSSTSMHWEAFSLKK